ncbi:MAG: NADH:ubiquinone oxidoreductase [Armatimonadetes bacterium]|nr:NADH:ubiquinone oxidoreductase [Armatimonadota bacterium]
MKPRVGMFAFTCCEGCGLAVLECENELLDVLNLINLVEWREGLSEKADPPELDIALVEGSISTHEDERKLKAIRERAKVLVALGACAHTGGLNALKNRYGMQEVKQMVYGDDGQQFDTIPARPLSAVVPVDLFLPGCPIDRNEFMTVVRDVALGKTPSIPSYPVCVECKKKENVCVFFKGMNCMGPVTRAGCGALCPTFGDGCEGCRGLVDNPNEQAHKETLAEAGLSLDEVLKHFDMFNSYQEDQHA